MTTTPRVLAFVEDPGAANGVVGLAHALAAHGLVTRVVATGPAEPFLRDKGVAFDSLPAGLDAGALLDREHPRVLLVGTSENPDTLGLALVDAARTKAIPSAGFVDASTNASYRFRGRSTDPFAHCPDLVLVPDTFTRDAFRELDLAADRITITGHPHYDTVLDKREALEREGQAAVRARAFPEAPAGARVVMFAAEVSTGFDAAQFQRSSDYTLLGRGHRDGRTHVVLEELVDALDLVRARSEEPIHLVLRLHPKNTREELEPLASEMDEVSRGGVALDAAFAADLVTGMTTTLLVEAALLGRPTLSIVPRPSEKEWLASARAGVTPCATTRAELSRELTRWAAGDAPIPPPFVERGAMRRMADALARLAGATSR